MPKNLVSRVRVPEGEPLDEVGADRGGVLVEQSAVLRAGANQGHVLPEHVVRGAALAHRVHPRLDEDLLPVLRDPQRLVQSVFVERHLLPASPQQPPPSLVLTMGLEVRGRPSAALSVTETVSFGFGFFYVLKIKSSQKLKNGSKQNR